MSEKQVRVMWAVILFGMCTFLLISFFSYDPADILFNTSSPNIHLKNFTGYVGAYLVWGLLLAIGWGAYFIPALFCLWAIGKIMGRITANFYAKFFGFFFVIWSFSAMMSTLTSSYNVSRMATGGILGFYTSLMLTKYFGEIGSMIILGTIFILSLLLATEFLIVPIVLQSSKGLLQLLKLPGFIKNDKTKAARQSRSARIRKVVTDDYQEEEAEEDYDTDGLDQPVKSNKRQKKKNVPEKEEAMVSKFLKLVMKKPQPKIKAKAKKETPARVFAQKFVGDYKLPPLDLLTDPPPVEQRLIKDDLDGNSRILEETLRDFNIEVKVTAVEQGPVLTRYELQPAPGVKINQIMNLGDDIALNLKAPSVHIVAPIPGKGTVGVDVPNIKATLVFLKELLETPDFQDSVSKVTLALGKDISGNTLVADLAAMPHLLIAGTTGAGKTVCVNILIMSLLFQASPEEVKLILVDPKMVEMTMYNGLPHLICPVINDVKKAAGALEWAVSEMEDRYKLLAKVGVRNIAGYNQKIKEGLKEIEDGDKKIPLELMPYIVIVIDELADMMLLSPKEVEGSITRLAQLSRAIGIHLVLATQRPSVDVITGLIKANFPARISFRVASKIDSRTVLDMNGADKLLGKGDMLFLKPGNFKLVRAQSALVNDDEIEKTVNFCKQQRLAVYSDEILKDPVKMFASGTKHKKDALFEEAAKLVINSQQASVSMLQRRLRLGYSRAARLIDMMEEEGIVGAFRGSKAREILVDSWDEVALNTRESEE
ncbi:MAG: DNA translocase FtsK [Candidatus Omnitrophica bacterium]|nr:DNA translocase FtsK [Candidatus Omnitrophota bacterium]